MPFSHSDTIYLVGKNIIFAVSNGRIETWIKDSPTDLKMVDSSFDEYLITSSIVNIIAITTVGKAY